MKLGFRRWLNNLAFTDPIAREQANLLQWVLLGLIVVLLLTAVVIFGLLPFSEDQTVELLLGAGLNLAVAVGCLALLFQLRAGRLRVVVAIVIGCFLALGCSASLSNQSSQQNMSLVFALAMSLAAFVLGRGAMLLTFGFSATWLAIVTLFGLNTTRLSLVSLPGFIILMGLLALFLDRFCRVLRSTLHAEQARTHELEHLRNALEETVSERTASLQATIQQLQASQATIRQIGAPIIPVLPGVIVAPLIGSFDANRAQQLQTSVLEAVNKGRITTVIFDLSSVALSDQIVIDAMLRTAAATQLLGAQPMLVGIGASLAQQLISLGHNLEGIAIYSSLQELIGVLLARSSPVYEPKGLGANN